MVSTVNRSTAITLPKNTGTPSSELNSSANRATVAATVTRPIRMVYTSKKTVTMVLSTGLEPGLCRPYSAR